MFAYVQYKTDNASNNQHDRQYGANADANDCSLVNVGDGLACVGVGGVRACVACIVGLTRCYKKGDVNKYTNTVGTLVQVTKAKLKAKTQMRSGHYRFSHSVGNLRLLKS